jgi:hypothetical protein
MEVKESHKSQPTTLAKANASLSAPEQQNTSLLFGE